MVSFSWNNFDEEFIRGIIYNNKTSSDLKPKHIIEDKDMLIPNMEMIAPYPTNKFVMTYRAEIESKLLSKHPRLVLKINKDVSKFRSKNYRSLLNELSKLELGSTLIGSYMAALMEIGNPNYKYEERSLFTQPITIDLIKSKLEKVPLHDYQEDAINRLHENLIKNDNDSGLLVMPTGSGKTRVATCFLLERMVSQGYQVIWLTHRHMLIDQTAAAFKSFAPLAKSYDSKLKQLKMACVSGEHASIRATEKDDDIIIVSVQSGFRNLEYLKTILKKKVIIVVDEAQHTVAMSYRRTIEYIRKIRKDAKLLGLTATPIRGTDDESKYLLKLFKDNIIYSISMGELIKKKILADPIFERIETNTNIEPFISIDEVKLIKKFGEIPSTLADKIAHSTQRNEVIIETYMKNKERYGKTLIFALNAYHCFTLCEELKKRGINCDYIYSGNKDNEVKIKRFKDSTGENKIDVLVNINILTEGSDVPDIQTVFLTRPTQSEGLVIQMIGRGMRGKSVGGTETAILVDFCDKWDTFNKWLNPEWIIGDAVEATTTDPGYKPKELIRIPWALIREIYEGISFKGDKFINNQLGLPIGWYPLLDEDGNDYTMIVWSEQFQGFSNMINDKKELQKSKHNVAKDIINNYFGGFIMPPSIKDIELFLINLLDSETNIEMFKFENRDSIDPVLISKKILSDNIGVADLEEYNIGIYDANKEIVDNIYGDFTEFNFRIMDQIKYKDGRGYTDTQIVEIPVELLPYNIEPTHNLDELMKEVIDEMFDGEYLGIESINWTDKPYMGNFAEYYHGGIIKINLSLNSPEVDKEVVKFLIYHELLHRDYGKHDKAFFREEHKYPDYTEHNRFLDYKFNNYKFEW